MPQRYPLEFRTDLNALRDICERACSVAAGSDQAPLKLEFRPDGIEVKIAVPEAGAGEEVLEGIGRLPEGKERMVRHFGGFLLLDGLRGSRVKEVALEVNYDSDRGPRRIRRVSEGVE